MNKKLVVLVTLSLFFISGLNSVSGANLNSASTENNDGVDIIIVNLWAWLIPSESGEIVSLAPSWECENIGEEFNENGTLFYSIYVIFSDHEEMIVSSSSEIESWRKGLVIHISGGFLNSDFDRNDEIPIKTRIEVSLSENIPESNTDNNEETALCYHGVYIEGKIFEKNEDGEITLIEGQVDVRSNNDLEEKHYGIGCTTFVGNFHVYAPKDPAKGPFSYTVTAKYNGKEKSVKTTPLNSFDTTEITFLFEPKSRPKCYFERLIDRFPIFSNLLSILSNKIEAII